MDSRAAARRAERTSLPGVVHLVRDLCRAQAIIFAAAVVSIAGVLLFSLANQIALTAAHDRDMVAADLAAATAKMRLIIEEASRSTPAISDAPSAHPSDPSAIDTTGIARVGDYATVAIVAADGSFVRRSVAAGAPAFDLRALFAKELAAAARGHAHLAAVTGGSGVATRWLWRHDVVYLIAAGPLYGRFRIDGGALVQDTPWMVIALALDAARLGEMSDRLGLAGIHLHRPGEGRGSNVLALRAADGETVAELAWNGTFFSFTAMLTGIALLGGGLVVLFVLGWLLMRRIALFGSELDRIHAATNDEKARLRTLFDNSNDALIVLDEEGTIVDCNRRLYERSGYRMTDLLGRSVATWIPDLPLDERAFRAGVRAFRTRLTDKSGAEVCVEVRANRFGREGRHHIVVSLRDITAQVRAEEKVWRQAHFDALTDLPNRSLFESRLDAALAGAEGRARVIMFVDLDGFKAVNDTLGHDAGDLLLVEVARRFRRTVGRDDLVARLGGDEFALILDAGADEATARDLAAALNVCLAEPYDLPQGRQTISASIGIALAPDDGTTTGALLKAADRAMYTVKRGARGRFALASAADGPGHRATKRRSPVAAG